MFRLTSALMKFLPLAVIRASPCSLHQIAGVSSACSPYAYNTNGNRGIACGLNNLQKLADGTPLGGRSRPEDDFADDDDDDDFLS